MELFCLFVSKNSNYISNNSNDDWK